MTMRRIALAFGLRLARACLPAVLPVLASFGVAAQTLDEMSMSQQGENLVARIGFNANVRLLRQAPLTAATLLRIEFELSGADERIAKQETEESRNLDGVAGSPALRITYVAVPRARVKQLTLQLSRAAVVKARQGPDARSIELVILDAASRAPATLAPASDRRYAVTLQTVPLGMPEKMLPVPVQFQSYDAFSLAVVVNGAPNVQVNLGYFETEVQAQRVRDLALARFPEAVVLDLFARRQDVLKAAAAATQAVAPTTPPRPTPVPAPTLPPTPAPALQPAPAPAAAAPPAQAPAAELSEVDRRAAELLDAGRKALLAKNHEAAIDAFNQLLLLPPNPSSQEAQELIGLAWERAANLARARTEYELYLKLFPKGEGADRVTQRLASLEGGSPSAAPSAAAAPAPAVSGASGAKGRAFSGSVAQYYYGGVARSQSLVSVIAGVDQQTLSRTTQSAIVTSADLNARFNQPDAETRLVVRGTGASNLSSESRNSSLLSSAYVDYRRVESGLGLRVGRQSAISGGLIGLFDGASMVVPVRRGLKVDLMAGVPANALVSAPAQRLAAAMLEIDGLAEGWGGNVYLLGQTVEGVTNRRAVGAEVRYSADTYSAYSLFDYDINFKTLNALTLQGSAQLPAQTTLTLYLDNRKAPSLQLTNALITTGQSSLKDYLAGHSLDEARAAALGITARARQGLVSLSRPLSERWQVSVDLRYSQIGALPAVGLFDATPATGAQLGASAQLTGSNLYSTRDISTLSASVTHTPMFNGTQLSYNNLTGFRDNDLTLEPSVRLYSQKSNDGLKLTRVTPGLRASYRVSRRASVIGESIVEFSNSDGPSGHDNTRSLFFTVGYRYEFN